MHDLEETDLALPQSPRNQTHPARMNCQVQHDASCPGSHARDMHCPRLCFELNLSGCQLWPAVKIQQTSEAAAAAVSGILARKKLRSISFLTSE